MTYSKGETARKWGLWIHVLWYVAANVGQVIVWQTATPEKFFWPLWSILGWGIGLGFHFWAVMSHSRARSGVRT